MNHFTSGRTKKRTILFLWLILFLSNAYYSTAQTEPIADFGVDATEGCAPLTVTFENRTIGTAQFTWDFGDGSPVETSSLPQPHTFQAGTFDVKLIAVGEHKTDSTTVRIEVLAVPNIQFEASRDSVFLPEEEILFANNTENANSYLWDFGDGATSTLPIPSHAYSEEGVYDVNLIVQNRLNCESDSTIRIRIENQFIVFPTAFQPNPEISYGGSYSLDIANRSIEIFYPIWKGIDENKAYSFQIFNRWGQLIFESKDIHIGWDGYKGGQLSPQGVYIYKVAGSFTNGKRFIKTGEITLIK